MQMCIKRSHTLSVVAAVLLRLVSLAKVRNLIINVVKMRLNVELTPLAARFRQK